MSSHGRLAGDESVSDINTKQKSLDHQISMEAHQHTPPLQYLEGFYLSGPLFHIYFCNTRESKHSINR
jgi:hypothetical protein